MNFSKCGALSGAVQSVVLHCYIVTLSRCYLQSGEMLMVTPCWQSSVTVREICSLCGLVGPANSYQSYQFTKLKTLMVMRAGGEANNDIDLSL